MQDDTLPKQNRDFVRLGRSRIEGKGLFAKRKIPKGTRIIEYAGKRLPVDNLWIEVDPKKPGHTYLFRLNETTVIDGAQGGNESRFINHSCDPNCEPYGFDGNMYIYAMRDIVRGEELTFDYKLTASRNNPERERQTKDEHICRCGAANCRGTMRNDSSNL